MSLQFYFGPSGSGKSRQLHMDIMKWADREADKNFLFLVPEQFTLQTQFDLVNADAQKGIMNVDVLSFGRLAHRIFEETGFRERPVLDDTGKSLVLRRISDTEKEKLSVIGGNLHKIGYIHEVKSALSEFMQYGLLPQQVGELAQYAKKRGTLYYKLKDLETVYGGFLSYIQDKFITTEETLELLTKAVEKSQIIKNSVVIFDGFTGFTPIQNRLIQKLMKLTDRVIVSITIDMKQTPFQITGEQELFYLSKKTVKDLCYLAEEADCGRETDVYLNENPLPRFRNNPELSHLERSLFRYPLREYTKKPENIGLFEALTPAGEARQVCIRIKELVLSGRYCYRDIAVVAGDLETYGDYLEREGKNYEIPMFMDRTRGIRLNPFIEFIRSGLKIVTMNFSYEAVFHYLRSGLADFRPEEIDKLENYVLALGMKGRKKWSEAFVRGAGNIGKEEQVLLLEELNVLRERLIQQLAPLLVKKRTAEEQIEALYDFITAAKAQEKLAFFEKSFREAGNPEKAKEYAQIYRLVMELLNQIYELLGKEELTLQEFADILDAGFDEIEIGIIPGGVDRVVVGDMERTRLKQVKVLFFMGVNDGNIPRSSTGGGILSDIDREFLQGSSFELAPTPRQQMYIQRLYLYMNMTKPSEKLILSYARVQSEGKSLRPSYLIDMMKKLFPLLSAEYPEINSSPMEQAVGRKDGLFVLADELRRYGEGKKDSQPEKIVSLLTLYERDAEYGELAEKMMEAAFMQYSHSPLSKAVAKAVYGTMLENSVSRLEQYAACAYAHFLQYGLSLKEREEYSFEQVDLGNIYHNVLEQFAGKLAEHHLTWFDFPDEEGDRLLKEALESCTVNYGETILYSNARYQYMTDRIYRILQRTVRTLKRQLAGGSFTPAHFEMSFQRVEDLKSVNLALSEQERMRLKGRIDRIDTCEDEEHVYVKVIDYKSGAKKFDLAALYYGLQLQLVVYMNVASELEQKKHPDKEIVPAALLYYHVNDPMLREEKELTEAEAGERLLKELRTTGVVNDSDSVISLLDKSFSDKSLLIPVERKKDGSFTANSGVIAKEDYETVSSFVNEKIKSFGREILNGNIAVNPCKQGEWQACTYCAFKDVCGFDKKIAGYTVRKLPDISKEEVLLKMKEERKE